ncbi:hydrolase [Novosphingopyxis baekryungensis]|uniref:hydrolase n=1 Tax=Novosphingopyxis baekryungensis TaxID=279369 RepID=UPI0003B49897|nr:hydrolase [Novosphingopyxis baekryungensis]
MTALNSTEQSVLDQIEQAPMLDRTMAWAKINSGTKNLQGLAAMAQQLGDAFSALPGEVELVQPDPVETMEPDGTIQQLNRGRHLVTTVRPGAPVQLLFTGHMDTVFPAESDFQELHWREDNILNGPGVADMKGGIAVMLHALMAVESSAAKDRIGYQIMINSDEEVGSGSSAALIARLAQGKTAALTYEPALPDGTLAGARGGSGNYSIKIGGRNAHAGRNPRDGRNAIVAAADLALRLKALMRDGLSVNPAKIDGGGANNVVPDHAILRINFRPEHPRDQQEAEEALERACAAIALEHEVTVQPHGGFGRPPKPLSEGAEKLFGLVKRSGADLGLDIGWRATGGVCDGNNIADCGIPVVDTMGVRGDAIHSADEILIVDSLAERARLSALTVLRLAEGAL